MNVAFPQERQDETLHRSYAEGYFRKCMHETSVEIVDRGHKPVTIPSGSEPEDHRAAISLLNT